MARILIADDDEGILDSTSLLLESEGYEVITAYNEKTIQKALLSHPDVIFLDIKLSDISGLDVLNIISSNVKTKMIPVILFSANSDIEAIAKKAKVHDFLVKPFEIDDMIKMIEKNLIHAPTS